MRFSILLPTRDRLEYLEHAVRSVARQSWSDWELVVADNASTSDIEAFVTATGDPRIHYIRSEVPLSVTENWNRAIECASGDYTIMLGDDDLLVPGCLEELDEIAVRSSEPDLLYLGAYLFRYPFVDPDDPTGRLEEYSYAGFFQDRTDDEPFELTRTRRVSLVDDFMDFRVTYGFNMQFAAMHARLLDRLRLRGPVFQSPFPDYYAMNAAMCEAERVVVAPTVRTVIGVTPKSYGYFLANANENSGRSFLDGSTVYEDLNDLVLPGTNINTSWLRAAATLAGRFPEFGFQPNVRRYRVLQMLETHKASQGSAEAAESEAQLVAELTFSERTLRLVALVLPSRLGKLGPRYLGRIERWLGQFIAFARTPVLAEENLVDGTTVFDALAAADGR